MRRNYLPWWHTWWVAPPILLGAGLVGLSVAALTRHLQPPPAPPPLCPEIDDRGGTLEGIAYVETRSGGAGAEDLLPMVVALHGAGMTSKQMASLASSIPARARIIAPQGFYPNDEGGHRWTDPTGEVPILDDATSLANFLEQLRRCRPTVGKPILVGYDEGADVAYAIAVDSPLLVSAVVGAGGRAPEHGTALVQTVAIHGEDDEVVPYAPQAEIWHRMIGDGAPVRLLRMPAVGHSFAGALQIKTWQEAARAATA